MELIPITSFPEVATEDDLYRPLLEVSFREGDILVVTHKVVSKAEGRLVDLSSVEPSSFATRFADRWDKDPRVIELVLRESEAILRMYRGVLITLTRHGLVCANAGVDLSNCDGGSTACLLPVDPDASARRIYERLKEHWGFAVPVIISDSFGRPWRLGLMDIAIGVAGIEVFTDYRGTYDPYGFPLRASLMATADALAAAAELVMGKVSGIPAAIVRGYDWSPSVETSGRDLIRPVAEWLYL